MGGPTLYYDLTYIHRLDCTFPTFILLRSTSFGLRSVVVVTTPHTVLLHSTWRHSVVVHLLFLRYGDYDRCSFLRWYCCSFRPLCLPVYLFRVHSIVVTSPRYVDHCLPFCCYKFTVFYVTTPSLRCGYRYLIYLR